MLWVAKGVDFYLVASVHILDQARSVLYPEAEQVYRAAERDRSCRGSHWWWRKSLDAAKRREIAETVLTGRKTGADMARLYNVSQPTVSRIVAEVRSQQSDRTAI